MLTNGYHNPVGGFTKNTHDFMKEWILEKYGWHNLKHYKKYLSSKRMILDVGASLGREVMNFCRYNPKAKVFGVELSNCVDRVGK